MLLFQVEGMSVNSPSLYSRRRKKNNNNNNFDMRLSGLKRRSGRSKHNEKKDPAFGGNRTPTASHKK